MFFRWLGCAYISGRPWAQHDNIKLPATRPHQSEAIPGDNGVQLPTVFECASAGHDYRDHNFHLSGMLWDTFSPILNQLSSIGFLFALDRVILWAIYVMLRCAAWPALREPPCVAIIGSAAASPLQLARLSPPAGWTQPETTRRLYSRGRPPSISNFYSSSLDLDTVCLTFVDSSFLFFLFSSRSGSFGWSKRLLFVLLLGTRQ